MLSCCTGSENAVALAPPPAYQTMCIHYPQCVAHGRTGACCPNATGTILGCCQGGTTLLADDDSAPVQSLCATHQACVNTVLGVGQCCPTPEGVCLECCSK